MWTVEGPHAGALVTVDGSVPAPPEVRFPVASLSKQFAAVAVLLLAERGALELHQPVSHWLPDGPPWWREATLHHLLTHTSGTGHWEDAAGFDATATLSVEEYLALLATVEPRSRPGIRWHYSNPGYLMVTRIVEQAAGQPYEAFLSEHLFAPAGMGATTTARPDGTGTSTARGHRDGEPLPGGLPPRPGVRVWSTAGDLARWTRALHTGDLLGWESRAVLTAPLAPTGEERVLGRSFFGPHYGYGLYVGTVGNHRAYFHPGQNPGYLTFAAWLPEHHAAVVVLADDESADLHGVIRQALAEAGLS
jgi:CubicO group peptidase (beta-lactamase class C family)